MEDVKKMVQDCLGPLPRVCPEHVLLDMERARMHAEDRRDFQAKERQLKEKEAQYDAALDLVQLARGSLQLQLSQNPGLSETSRRHLHGVNNLLSAVHLVGRVSD